jgi:hypothetical protein
MVRMIMLIFTNHVDQKLIVFNKLKILNYLFTIFIYKLQAKTSSLDNKPT